MKPIARAFLFMGFAAAAAGWVGSGCAGRTGLSAGSGGSGGMVDSGGRDGFGGGTVDGNGAALGSGGRMEAGGGSGSGGSSGGAGGAVAVDAGGCDGAALNGDWRRAVDGLIMTLVADGCAISGTVDSPSFRHTVIGTYDDAVRTMQGTIKRTNISSGCTTIMTVTLVLTDSTHFLLAITGTDGRCDLLTTYNEASFWLRQ